MTPVLFFLLVFFGSVLAVSAAVAKARDATYSYMTLVPCAVGIAMVTAAFTGALY